MAGVHAVSIASVEHHCHAGVHPGHSIEAALSGGVEPGCLQLQLVIAGHLNEGAPAEGSLEASSEPRRKEAWGKPVPERGSPMPSYNNMHNAGRTVTWQIILGVVKSLGFSLTEV